MKIVLVLLICSVVLVDRISALTRKCEGSDCDRGWNGKYWPDKNWEWKKPSIPFAKLEMDLKYLMFKVEKLSQQIENIPIDLYKYKQIYRDNYWPRRRNDNWSNRNDNWPKSDTQQQAKIIITEDIGI